MAGGVGRVATAMKATSLNILLHIAMRICTFVLNAFILRWITRDAFGVINVRLMLLFSTIHFLASEPFRRACCTDTGKHQWNRIIQLSWLCVPLSIFIGGILSWIWIYVLESPVDPSYSKAVIITFIASVFEVSAEPMFIIGCAFGYVKFKVFAEGSALALRCILMSTLVFISPSNALIAFAVSQLIASIYFSTSFYAYFSQVTKNKLDKDLPIARISQMIPTFRDMDLQVGSLALSFTKQTLFKQLLTEGERYVMTTFCVLDFASQGVYEAVNNLGSLAARFIFQQVEENGYLLFGQILSRGKGDIKKEDITFGASILCNLTKLMLIIALTIIAFGQAYSGTLLYLYAGDTLLPLGKTLLQYHCIYIAFIAVNGITECFVFATMSKKELDEHSKKMALCSLIFLLSSYIFSKILGAVGLIFANMLNMSMRVFLSCIYIREFHATVDSDILTKSLPSFKVILILVISWILTSMSEASIGHRFILHISFGAVLFFLTLAVIFFSETELRNFIKQSFIDKRI